MKNEEKRLREKAERKETRRINRITENIITNVISTKEFIKDIPSIQLADIDDFSNSPERIHVIGGIFGLCLIVVEELFKKYNMWENNEENLNMITFVIEEYLLNGLKDNHFLEIKYLESKRFNFSEIPSERQDEFIEFIYDYRRFVNKSIKLLIEKNLISKTSLDLLLNVIVGIYFKDKSTIPQVEINNDNQEPEYIELKNKEKETYLKEIDRIEKLKKKIKFRMIKPALLKRRRDNMAGFIEVLPNEAIKENVIDFDEPPQIDKEKDRSKLNISKLSQNPEEKKHEDGENVENKENDRENKEEDSGDITSKEKSLGEEDVSVEKKPEDASIEKKAEDKKASNAAEDEEADGDEGEENEEKKKQEENAEGKKEGEEGEKVEEKKKEEIMVKAEYLSEAQIFKNMKMKFEPYIIHKDLHKYALINIAKSFRKLLKKEHNLTVDWSELINCANEKYEIYYETIYRHVLDNEIYIKESIVPITAKPLEIEKEKPANTENPDGNNPNSNNSNIEQDKPADNKSSEKTDGDK